MPKSKPNPHIPNGLKPWPHEFRVAKILADAGHVVEFLPTGLRKTADMLIDGIPYELKSPEFAHTKTIERAIKKALHQSNNLIVDASQMKHVDDVRVHRILINQIKLRKSIKRLLYVNKKKEILDIFTLV